MVFLLLKLAIVGYIKSSTVLMVDEKSTIANDSIKAIVWNEHLNKVYKSRVERGVGVFREPIRIEYRKAKKPVYNIEIEKPVIVYQAEEKKGWGFVQFPRIFKQDESKIAVVWNLNEDDIRAQPRIRWKYSKDKGKTWFFRWKERPVDRGLVFSDTESYSLTSRFLKASKFEEKGLKAQENQKEPLVKSSDDSYIFFESEGLPYSLVGFNYTYTKGKEKIKGIAPVRYLPNTIKYTYKGVFPNQLWGKIVELDDGTFFTCQYPYFYKDGKGNIGKSSIAFYESKDRGKSWQQISYIPFYVDERFDGDNSQKRNYIGYSEPMFEVFGNEVVCIMRSSPGYFAAPMYMSISEDLGKTWTKPKAISNNGVSPQILKLGNGIIVLSSGRPGVQLRFANSRDANFTWSDPIEMLRFEKLRGQVSCGYTELLPLSESSFLVVYSDFRSRDDENNIRKAIIVRKINIKKI